MADRHPFIEGLDSALDVQRRVVDQLSDAHLALPSACAGWSVREVLAHSVGVTLKFAAFAAGVTDAPRTPAGDLLRPDRRTSVRRAVDEARRSWADTDPDRPCRLPFGTFPAAVAAGINLFDVLAHTWDVAAPARLATPFPDHLWELGLDAARTVVGPGRDTTHYGPELPSAAHDPPAARFLRFLGRDPGAPAGP